MSLVPVYKASSSTHAVIMRDMLRGAGIEAELRTDDANGLFPSLDLSDGVDVLVDESKVGEAETVLEQYRRGETAIEDDQEV
jgi:hypothetical protein